MNKQLHSKLTFVQRLVFPVVVGVVVTWAVVMPLFDGAPWQVVFTGGIIAGLVMLVVGLSYWALAWPLMDEAFLTDSSVKVRRGKVREEIALSSVKDITWQTSYNPQNITLHLDHETALGQKIAFMPPGQYLWGRPHPLVAELRTQIAKMKEAHEPAI